MEFLVSRGPERLFVGTNLGSAAEKGILGTSILIDFDRLGTVYSSEPAPGGRLIYMLHLHATTLTRNIFGVFSA